MSRRVAVLRPQPGNRATVAMLDTVGLQAIALPLFEIAAIAWVAPDPAGYDGVLLTSANAVRCAGSGLAALATLPVFAVGETTARAAREARLNVIATGDEGAAAIVGEAAARGHCRLLHLAGRDRSATLSEVATTITVYESLEIARDPHDLLQIEGQVAMLHSPRAARRFAALGATIDRAAVRLAALSPAVAGAAGQGWQEIAIAATRDDAAMVALARRLAD